MVQTLVDWHGPTNAPGAIYAARSGFFLRSFPSGLTYIQVFSIHRLHAWDSSCSMFPRRQFWMYITEPKCACVCISVYRTGLSAAPRLLTATVGPYRILLRLVIGRIFSLFACHYSRLVVRKPVGCLTAHSGWGSRSWEAIKDTSSNIGTSSIIIAAAARSSGGVLHSSAQ